MRFFKILFFLILFFLGIIFVAQNNIILNEKISFSLDLFFIAPLTTIPLPLYFILFIIFLFGAILFSFFLLLDKLRLSWALGKSNKKNKILEKELNSLRTLPLDDTTNIFSSSENSKQYDKVTE